MAYTFPEGWHSLHQPIYFEMDAPIDSTQSGVIDSAGLFSVKVPLALADIIDTKQIFLVSDVTYNGMHTVKEITDAGSYRLIITNTPYVGNPLFITTVKYLWPFKVKVWVGYPTPAETEIVINCFYGPDGNVKLNVSPFFKEFFKIVSFAPFVDVNMFKWFRLEVMPGDRWFTYMDDNSETIESMTGFDFGDLDNICWVANGCLPHDELQAKATANAILTNAPVPILTASPCIFSVISDDGKIYNSINIT